MDIMPWRSRQSSLTPISTLSPISSLQSEMNRMFEDFFTQPFGYSIARSNGSSSVVVPALDVKETPENIVVSAELPGIAREDIEININDDMLEIRGQKAQETKQDQDNFHLLERSYGSFARRIRLPTEVDSDRAKAKMEHGVLTLEMPKAEPKKGMKKIAIQ